MFDPNHPEIKVDIKANDLLVIWTVFSPARYWGFIAEHFDQIQSAANLKNDEYFDVYQESWPRHCFCSLDHALDCGLIKQWEMDRFYLMVKINRLTSIGFFKNPLNTTFDLCAWMLPNFDLINDISCNDKWYYNDCNIYVDEYLDTPGKVKKVKKELEVHFCQDIVNLIYSCIKLEEVNLERNFCWKCKEAHTHSKYKKNYLIERLFNSNKLKKSNILLL